MLFARSGNRSAERIAIAALPSESTRAIWSRTIWNEASGGITARLCRLSPRSKGQSDTSAVFAAGLFGRGDRNALKEPLSGQYQHRGSRDQQQIAGGVDRGTDISWPAG